MSDRDDRSITPHKGGFFQDLSIRLKLIFRLMGDPRVAPWLKLIPVGSLVYLLFPDIAPGPIDDAAVIWLGFYLFVELCPPEVVEEHMVELTRTIQGEWRDPEDEIEEEDIVEGEFREEQ